MFYLALVRYLVGGFRLLLKGANTTERFALREVTIGAAPMAVNLKALRI